MDVMDVLKGMHRWKTINFYNKKCRKCGLIWRTEITGVTVYLDKDNRMYESLRCEG